MILHIKQTVESGINCDVSIRMYYVKLTFKGTDYTQNSFLMILVQIF